MIDGNPYDFVKTVYTGQDIVFLFHGIKYWFQGYTIPTGFHMEIFQCQPPEEEFVWEHDDSSSEKCGDAFLTAPIFNGKTFWEAEQEIQWVDC